MEVHLDRCQQAGAERAALAPVARHVEVLAPFAGLANAIVGHKGRVGTGNFVVVEGLNHRQPGSLESRQYRRGHLMNEAMDVDQIGLRLGQQAFQIVLCLARIEYPFQDLQLWSQPGFAQFGRIVDVADKVLAVLRRQVVGVVHGERDHLMAMTAQQRGMVEEAALAATSHVVEAVDQQDLHDITHPTRGRRSLHVTELAKVIGQADHLVFAHFRTH